MNALTAAIIVGLAALGLGADPRAAIVAALAGGFFSHWRA